MEIGGRKEIGERTVRMDDTLAFILALRGRAPALSESGVGG